MAKKQETILNFGNSHISINVFSADGGDLVLEESYMETLHRDLTNDSIWMDCVFKVLGELSQNIKGKVRVILPGSMLISKTIRVPHVEAEKQRKIVSFELSQKMPMPLSDLVWDYVTIDDDGVEEEILAFAVKPEIVEKFCDKLVNLGINPIQITPAPILDYVAFKHILGEVEQGNESLIINIGAKTTNLLFINQTGYLIRTIAIGGNTLSQNISDSLGISFEKAESLKKAHYSNQISLTEEDPSLASIHNANNQFLARASQEITRSIVTIKRLKKGQSPRRIYLTGRGAFLPNLSQYLQDSQQIEVSYFNPLSGLKISPAIPEQIKALFPYILGEPIGMARGIFFGSTNDNSNALNLLPEKKLASIAIKKKTPFLAISAVLFSIIPLPFLLSENFNKVIIKNKISTLEKKYFSLEEEISLLDIQKKKLNFITSFSNDIRNLNSPYIDSLKSNWLTLELINYLQGIIEDNKIGDVWIDNFALEIEDSPKIKNSKKGISQDYKLTLSGRYLVRPNTVNEDISLRDQLIDLDREKKQSLTQYLNALPYINKIDRSSFSIEGKGDLFNRYFSHFEYEISLNVR